jgi:Flp pilus assembly protein TadG
MPSVDVSRRERPRSDRGSATVEAVLLAPALVVLLLFVLHLGRWSSAEARLRTAADHAARAASLVHPSRMSSAAREAALDNLVASGLTCERFAVSAAILHASDPRVVEVAVECDVARAGLDALGMTPRRLSVSSSEVVDRWRADS